MLLLHLNVSLLVWRVEVPTDCLNDGWIAMQSKISTIHWLIKCTKYFIVCGVLPLINSNFSIGWNALCISKFWSDFNIRNCCWNCLTVKGDNAANNIIVADTFDEWRKMYNSFFLYCLPRALIHPVGWWGESQTCHNRGGYVCPKKPMNI